MAELISEEEFRDRVHRRIAEEGIPVGFDDPAMHPLGTRSYYGIAFDGKHARWVIELNTIEEVASFGDFASADTEYRRLRDAD